MAPLSPMSSSQHQSLFILRLLHRSYSVSVGSLLRSLSTNSRYFSDISFYCLSTSLCVVWVVEKKGEKKEKYSVHDTIVTSYPPNTHELPVRLPSLSPNKVFRELFLRGRLHQVIDSYNHLISILATCSLSGRVKGVSMRSTHNSMFHLTSQMPPSFIVFSHPLIVRHSHEDKTEMTFSTLFRSFFSL